jgi:hypothetical protein
MTSTGGLAEIRTINKHYSGGMEAIYKSNGETYNGTWHLIFK